MRHTPSPTSILSSVTKPQTPKIANMSSVVLETWTQVKTTKKRSGKKKAVTGASGERKSNTPQNRQQNRSFPRPRFDFGEPTDKVTHPPVTQKEKQHEPKRQVSWSSVVTTGKASSQEKDKKFITYLYEHEVDALARTMRWGDFEVMMDDVVMVEDGQPKPESSH